MDAILGFFSGVADLAVGAFDFLLGIIRDLLYIVQMTARAVSAIPGLFRLLPASCLTVIVGIFGVVVIYKILGREG